MGQGILFSQGGPGSSPGFGAVDLRRAISLLYQEGAIDAGSYKVTTGGAGLDLSVAAATGAGLVIEGDTITEQGHYVVPPHSTTITETVSTADATDPRLDQLVGEIRDDSHDASGLSLSRLRIIAGTPTAGATKENRSGAAALPDSAVRLADILVEAGETGPFVAGDIRDRRPWARGFNFQKTRTSNIATFTATSPTEIDTTNMKMRGEFSDKPLRVVWTPQLIDADGQQSLSVRLFVDGVAAGQSFAQNLTVESTTQQPNPGFTWELPSGWLSSGSHQISIAASVGGGSWTFQGSSGNPMWFSVREILQQEASNE